MSAMNSTRLSWALDGEAVVWRSVANHGYIVVNLLPLDALEDKLTCCGTGHIHVLLILIIIMRANDYFAKMVSTSWPLKGILH